MIFSRPAGVGRHDLTPQNSTLFLEQAFALRLLWLNLTPTLAERENPYFWTDTIYPIRKLSSSQNLAAILNIY